MNCPRCHTALAEEIYLGYKVSVCTTCQGILLPQVNLIGLVEKTEAEEAPQATIGNKAPDPAQKTSLTCPKCLATMSNHGYMGDESIIIDTCIDCGLLWADGGELQKMSALYNTTEEKSKARRLKNKKEIDALSVVLEMRAKGNALLVSPFGLGMTPQDFKEERARHRRKNPKQKMPAFAVFTIVAFTLVVFGYSAYGLITGELWMPSFVKTSFVRMNPNLILLKDTQVYFGFATLIFTLLAAVSFTANHYSNDASENYYLVGKILLGAGCIALLLAMIWPLI